MALIDRGNLYINSKRLQRMKGFKLSDGTTREGFIPVGAEDVIGTTLKPGVKEIEIEEKPDTSPDYDWEVIKGTGELLTVVVQYVSGVTPGARLQCKAQVSEFTPPEGNDQGDYMQTIKLIVIGRWVKLS